MSGILALTPWVKLFGSTVVFACNDRSPVNPGYQDIPNLSFVFLLSHGKISFGLHLFTYGPHAERLIMSMQAVKGRCKWTLPLLETTRGLTAKQSYPALGHQILSPPLLKGLAQV